METQVILCEDCGKAVNNLSPFQTKCDSKCQTPSYSYQDEDRSDEERNRG